jgi:uncharacterized delta-60 repeat protein
LVFPYNPDTGNDAYRLFTQLLKIPLLDNTNPEPNRTIVVTLIEPLPIYSNSVSTNVEASTNDPNIQVTNVVTNLVITPVPMNAYFDTYDTHTFTILDDDASTVTVEVDTNNPVAKEQNQVPGVFLIKRTNTNSTQKVTFQFSGLASEGGDFEPVGGSATIPAGESEVRVPVIPVDDPVQEYMEPVTITLLTAPGATLGAKKSAGLDIIDNDGTTEFTAVAYSAAEGAGTVPIPIRRSGDTTSPASIDFAVTAGTAVDGVDFLSTNGTVTFTNGQSVLSIPVVLLDDQAVEPSKTVTLSLSNGAGGAPLGGQDVSVLTITDDDSQVEFSKPSYRVNENGTNVLITLRRLGILTNQFTVDLVTTNDAVTNGIAVAGVDFVAANLTVSFAAGQTETNIVVRLRDDNLLEGDETALLILTNAVVTNSTGSITLGTNATANLVIVDDECAFQFGSPTYSVEEYARLATVAVQRVGGAVNTVTVDFQTQPGTARSPDQYERVSGTLTFRGDTYVLRQDGSGLLDLVPGETNKLIGIRIIDNSRGEGDKTFSVTLSNPRVVGSAFTNSVTLAAPTNTVVTIVDDETPGHVDYAFDPGSGADGRVQALDVQTDGKVLLGGSFLTIDGVFLNRAARLQSDGYLDSFLNPGSGPNDTVWAIAVQPDGRILLGGEFTLVVNQSLRRIARLNADGALDPGFDPGAGADGTVQAIAVQRTGASGTILIGGAFSSVNGISRGRIARLNDDGSVDPSFDPGVGAAGGDVFAVASLSDGKVLIGGSFTAFGGAGRRYLARLNANGSADNEFMAGGALDGPVHSIAVQADGRILIAGEFTLVNGVSRGRVARVNADGSLDTSFDPGTGANDSINAVAVAADGKVLVGGAFTNFNDYVSTNGFGLNRLARLNPDGRVDTSFDLGSGVNDTIWTVFVQPDSAVVIGGDFTMVRGLNRSRIARIHGEDAYRVNRLQFERAIYQVVESAPQATISVVRSGDVSQPATVRYATGGGTATPDSDYTAASGALSFGINETQKTFTVPILNDGLAEGDETVGLTLSNLPAGYVTNAVLNAVLVIQDDESTVAFSQADYVVDEGAGTAAITVRRTGFSTNAISVDYLVRDGTATAGSDYAAVGGTLNFGATDSEQAIRVTLLDDSVIETNETVLLELFNPQGGAVLGRLTNATLTIRDDDQVLFYYLNVTPTVGGSVEPKSGRYDANTEVTVVPTPNFEYAFDYWEVISGNLSALRTDDPLRLIMDRDYTVAAKFRPVLASFTFEPPFAAEDLTRSPWIQRGPAPWTVSAAVAPAHGGRFALRSGAIGDSQETTLSLVVDTIGGAMSFDYLVSSEQNWDGLEFSVNGQPVGGGRSWSGEETGWRSFQYTLPPGRHVLTWRYSKDANFSSGFDAAFIDNVYVPTVPARFLIGRLANGAPVIQPNGQPDIKFHGKQGLTFVLQASSDLGSPTNWTSLSTNVLSGTPVVIDDPAATNQALRFYRAVSP